MQAATVKQHAQATVQRLLREAQAAKAAAAEEANKVRVQRLCAPQALLSGF